MKKGDNPRSRKKEGIVRRVGERNRSKLEPWFHEISIVLPLMHCFMIFIAMEGYSTRIEGLCFFGPNYPPRCIGYESEGDAPEGFGTTPCWRGNGEKNPILYLVGVITGIVFGTFMPLIVIIVTMLLMCRSVSKIEKNMQRYGVGSLRLNARRSGRDNHDNNAETNSTNNATCTGQGIMCRIKLFCSSLRNREWRVLLIPLWFIHHYFLIAEWCCWWCFFAFMNGVQQFVTTVRERSTCRR